MDVRYPLQSDVDMTSNYVATICLEEYGPCLQVASSDDIQLLGQLTDNFSLSALKVCMCGSINDLDPIKIIFTVEILTRIWKN